MACQHPISLRNGWILTKLTYRYIVTLSLLQIQSVLKIYLFKLVGGHTFSSENTVLVWYGYFLCILQIFLAVIFRTIHKLISEEIFKQFKFQHYIYIQTYLFIPNNIELEWTILNECNLRVTCPSYCLVQNFWCVLHIITLSTTCILYSVMWVTKTWPNKLTCWFEMQYCVLEKSLYPVPVDWSCDFWIPVVVPFNTHSWLFRLQTLLF